MGARWEASACGRCRTGGARCAAKQSRPAGRAGHSAGHSSAGPAAWPQHHNRTCPRQLGIKDRHPRAAPVVAAHAQHARRVERRGQPLLAQPQPRERRAARERQRAGRGLRLPRDVEPDHPQPLRAASAAAAGAGTSGGVPARVCCLVGGEQVVALGGERGGRARQRYRRELAAGGRVDAQQLRRRGDRYKALAWGGAKSQRWRGKRVVC